MKNPELVYLEPYCHTCFKDETKYFQPEPHGRQWAKKNLWPNAICEKCTKPITSPVYQLKEGDGKDD